MTDTDCPPWCPAEAGGSHDHADPFVVPGWRVDWPVIATPRSAPAPTLEEAVAWYQQRPVPVVVEPLTYLRCAVCGTPVQDDDTCPHCGDIA